MRKYELMTIAKPSLTDEQAKKISQEIVGVVTSAKGSVLKTDFWGKRKLAYEVKGVKEGYYDVLNFELEPSDVDKLKGKLRLMDNILKYLVILDLPKKVDTKVAKAKAQKA